MRSDNTITYILLLFGDLVNIFDVVYLKKLTLDMYFGKVLKANKILQRRLLSTIVNCPHPYLILLESFEKSERE